MQTLWDILNEFWELTVGYFFNPNKRIHLLYLFSSLLLAYYVFYRTKRKGSFWRYVFHRKVWLGKSASIDYMMFLCNGLLKLLLITPYIYFGFFISFEVSDFLTTQYGYVKTPLSFTKAVILYTIVLTLFTDFFSYLIHLAMHKVPFLGANVFSFLFFILGANLRHSHIKLRYFNFLEYLFISPVQHQIHHSKARKHWNKNMGSRLAIWDWMFGTLCVSKGISKLSFGLGGKEDPKYTTFLQNMLNPFVNNFRRIRGK